MIVVRPRGGLCNYLRVIFSYYHHALKQNQKLLVIWNKTAKCNGYFKDYFQEVENIEFIYDDFRRRKINYGGNKWHSQFNPNKMYIYEKLKLLPHIQKVIEEKKNKLENNYDAVHIRRTDHISTAKRFNSFTPDKKFIDFIKSKKSKHIYIATDNIGTFSKFKKLFNINQTYHKTLPGLRKTSMLDAIIDIYMCANSNKFLGSGYSSFSQLIVTLQKQFKNI